LLIVIVLSVVLGPLAPGSRGFTGVSRGCEGEGCLLLELTAATEGCDVADWLHGTADTGIVAIVADTVMGNLVGALPSICVEARLVGAGRLEGAFRGLKDWESSLSSMIMTSFALGVVN
jgi:hypothetical protein